MTKNFDEIRFTIDTLFERNNLKLGEIKEIHLPSLEYNIYKNRSLEDGFNLTWWGIPIIETEESNMFFTVKVK